MQIVSENLHELSKPIFQEHYFKKSAETFTQHAKRQVRNNCRRENGMNMQLSASQRDLNELKYVVYEWAQKLTETITW